MITMMVMLLIMKVMTTMADVDEVDVFSCSSLSFVLVVFSLCLPFPRSRPLVLVIVEPHQGARHPSQSKSVVPEAWPYGGARLFFAIQLEDLETAPMAQPTVNRSLGTASGTRVCPFCGPLRCYVGVVGTTFGSLVCPLLGALGFGVVI